MRALYAGEESWVKTLVAHRITRAVVEAEVRAIAVEGGGRCGQAGREDSNVGIHDVLEVNVEI
jgi:hypothetical protein